MLPQEFFHNRIKSPLQALYTPLLIKHSVRLWLKRDDQLHPEVSGNKFRKLKYNALQAAYEGHQAFCTFGGAYSNHLYATAALGHILGWPTIGIVRGEELNPFSSPTLRFCAQKGMKLHFVSRTAYRNKNALAKTYAQNAYLLPEGGSNALAIKGIHEMVDEVLSEIQPHYICTAIGSGGTLAGIVSNPTFRGKAIGFSSFKNTHFLEEEINNLINNGQVSGYEIINKYPLGGYGKTKPELLAFMRTFEQENGVFIEQVYTAKMLFGIYDLIAKGYFPEGSNIVAIHTGGLQGRILNEGYTVF